MQNYHSPLIKKIKRLKKHRNAIILAHNYQLGEVQDIADYVGDSLGLSQKAAESDAEVIIFCGVHFMAETASIFCPDKTVLMPDIKAGCPMADMITAEGLRALKKKYLKATVVCYVNTIAEVQQISLSALTSAIEVMVHPECTPPVIALANKVLSTGGMCRCAKESKAREIIVGTETGILHRLQKNSAKTKRSW